MTVSMPTLQGLPLSYAVEKSEAEFLYFEEKIRLLDSLLDEAETKLKHQTVRRYIHDLNYEQD